MKTLVIYYSYTGTVRNLAEKIATETGATLYEIKDKTRPGTLKAYSAGCFAALRMGRWPIQPVNMSFEGYGSIILMAPVWAGHPAPAFNNVYGLLPRGQEVEVRMVSASGSSSAREKIQRELISKGCKMTGYRDIKSKA